MTLSMFRKPFQANSNNRKSFNNFKHHLKKTHGQSTEYFIISPAFNKPISSYISVFSESVTTISL
ncbi:hypothetical protein J2X05_003046 [Cellvibrio fibrivorans]|uniref:Uncharacterized protein n=1 Tax=Cellvibrio fibrivorans TaxID=126350 RepID=A0ABU1V0Q6_9GAMM|nr:hypothetical protein [Cellvibrio fibrivorans]